MNLIGKLLIAPPSVKGNLWYKTVIMVTEHHRDGSIGLIINKRSPVTVNELGERLGLEIDLPGFVYIGGPISPKSLSIIHSNEWRTSNTLRINNQFSLSSSEDMLTRLSRGDTPKEWRMIAGMCGWAEHQLMNEINGISPYKHENSWCIASSDPELVFDTDNKEQWANALDKSGMEFAQSILA
jgi:putative transcriptional regulator